MGVTRVVCFASQIVLLGIPLFGQQAGNRLLLETGGPVGTIYSLRFSPDSRRLYAAGIDKQVHVWDLYDGPGGDLAPQHVQYLRWEANRADRGTIYAMDISANGRRLAFGGYSVRGNAGDVVVYDQGARMLKGVLPHRRPDHENLVAPKGHLAPIIAVSFAPSGKPLVSMGKDGVTRVWWGTEEQNRVLRTLKLESDNQTAAFVDDKHVAVAMPAEWKTVDRPLSRETADRIRYGQWRVVIFDASSGAVVRTIATNHNAGVTAISRDPFKAGRWASADGDGRLFVWDSIEARNPTPIDLWNDRIKAAEVRSLQFGPNDQLLVSTGSHHDPEPPRSAKLALLGIQGGKLVVRDSTVVSEAEHAHTCALSPDGKLAAVFSGEAQEVWLYSLNSTKPQAKVLDDANRIVLSGQGRPIRKVAFAKSNRSIITMSSTKGDEYEYGFDVSASRFLRGEQVPQSHAPAATGWELESGDNGHHLTIKHRDSRPTCQIHLHAQGQGPMESYCWLHDKAGSVYGIAIGTAKQNGIFAYRFEPGGECRLVRYFRDHRGPVNALSVSHDGAYLVSCSPDQTVKVWSLRGLLKDDPHSPKAAGWGGHFRIQGNDLIVTNLDENGILAQREFNDGDVITRIAYSNNGTLQTAAAPGAMLQFLRDRELWNPLIFQIKGREQETEIYSGWQPLLTLFLTRDESWAVWTPQGYYDASTDGDEFFGWVENRGRDETSGFYQAARMRPELERPSIIRELLAAGQLSTAFQNAGLELPDNYRDPVPNLLGQAPSVRIIEPIDGADQAGNQSIVVEAEVLYSALQDAQKFQLQAFVNQSFSSPAAREVDRKRNLIRYRFVVDSNDLNAFVQVKLFDLEQKNESGFHHVRHQDQVRVVAGRRLRTLGVHFVGIGGSKYRRVSDRVGGCEDVTSFHQQLVALQKKSQYQLSAPLTFLDEKATPENIASKLKQKRDIENDDLLIVFLAGHGNYDNKHGFYFVPAVPQINNAKKPTDAQIEKFCIRRDSLDPLARENCRRLFIVDTCHAEVFDKTLKAQVRDWKSQNILVFCSARADQNAVDGAFTKRLIDAIAGAADRVKVEGDESVDGEKFVEGDEDGFVTLLETESYVNREFKDASHQPKLFKEEGADSLLNLRLFKHRQDIPIQRR